MSKSLPLSDLRGAVHFIEVHTIQLVPTVFTCGLCTFADFTLLKGLYYSSSSCTLFVGFLVGFLVGFSGDLLETFLYSFHRALLGPDGVLLTIEADLNPPHHAPLERPALKCLWYPPALTLVYPLPLHFLAKGNNVRADLTSLLLGYDQVKFQWSQQWT